MLENPLFWLSLGTLALSGAGVLLGNRTPRRPEDASDYGSHGSGQWADPDAIRTEFPSTGAGAVLGRLPERNGWRPVIFPWDRKGGNRFVLLIGPPGSGKTFTYTLPNLIHAAHVDRQRSLVVTDPKGDLHRDTSRLMEAAGFRVLTLNLIDFATSSRYNPMDYVTTPEDAQRLAATIVSNTEGPHSGGESFWRHSEEALIACLIWYCKSELPKDEQHLGNVLHLAGIFAADKDLMDRTFSKFSPFHSVKRLYAPIAGLEDKTRAGVFVGVTASRLKIWASDRITELTATSDFDVRDLGKKPTVLYLIIPDHDSTYRVLSSLFFDQCFQQLIGLADHEGGRLPIETRLLLEEMANIGRIPDLEKRLATIRSRGLIVEMVLQTLGQLKGLYGDAWITIVGCADTMLVLAANDLETAQYVSQRLGSTTIKTLTQSSTQADRGESQGLSQQYTGRPLMTPEEVMGQGAAGLRQHELILVRRGLQARIHKNPVSEWPGHHELQQAHKSPPRRSKSGTLGLTDPAALQPALPSKKPKEGPKRPQWVPVKKGDAHEEGR